MPVEKESPEEAYPRISLVTASYNQCRFIEDAIKSVLEQHYPNFEHIIIDNCSTDGTVEILKKYPHLMWVSEPDKGQSDALNKAFRQANGDWILWLNADDYLLPGALETFKNAILKNNSADFFCGHTQFVDEFKEPMKIVYKIPYSYFLTFFGVYVPPSTGGLFRASLLKENPLAEEYYYTMDTEWFLRCGKRLKTVLVDKVVFAFRVSSNSKTFQNTRTGIVLPEHAKERRMNKQKYVFPRMFAHVRALQELAYDVGHSFSLMVYYGRKLRYGHEYLRQAKNRLLSQKEP